jgi:hypothetical protein
MHAADLAEFAAVDEVFDFFEAGVRAHVEHGGEDLRFVRVRGDEALAVGFVDGDGFFDQDVQASFQRFDADGGVAEMGRADQDGVDVARLDHGTDISEGLLTFLEWWDGAVTLAEAGDFKSGYLTGANVCEMGFAHVSEAYDAESDDVHSEGIEGLVRAAG